MKLIEKEPVRKTTLHCHISQASKRWLKAQSQTLNLPMGAIVDKLVIATKTDKSK